jgi:hypothetical protein
MRHLRHLSRLGKCLSRGIAEYQCVLQAQGERKAADLINLSLSIATFVEHIQVREHETIRLPKPSTLSPEDWTLNPEP